MGIVVGAVDEREPQDDRIARKPAFFDIELVVEYLTGTPRSRGAAAPMHHEDLIAPFVQPFDHPATEKPRLADDQDTHSLSLVHPESAIGRAQGSGIGITTA